MRSSNFHIQHQCPQCGAPALLEETDRLVTCGYCRTSSYLLQDGVFRYILPVCDAAGQEEIFHVPYWRFKGVLYTWFVDGEIDHRFMDMSHLALESDLFPVSLGFRSQALKLRFAASVAQGRFLKTAMAEKQVMSVVQDRFHIVINRPVLHQEFIGEALSIIYLPVYIKNRRIYDAVLGTPLPATLPESFDIGMFKFELGMDDIRFIPTLCPGCGWDLSGAKDSMALHCTNCGRIWQPTRKGLRQLPVSSFPLETGIGTLSLPFWKIKASVTGIDLESYADLIKLANLPKVIRDSHHDKEVYFWSPAFKIRPKQFLLLSRIVTLAQPADQRISSIPETQLHPVTLPVSEAAESLKISLASLIKSNRLTPSSAQSITFHPKTYSLCYIPFTETAHEVSRPDLNLSIHKSLIALAHNL